VTPDLRAAIEAVHARIPAAGNLPGGWMEAYRQDVGALLARLREVEAALANELGLGDPPHPGWERNDLEPGDTTWYWRGNTDGTGPPVGSDDDDRTRVCWVQRTRVDDSPTTEGGAHDTARPWRWEVEQVTHRATRQVSGLAVTAREGMRLAAAAVAAGRPE
jgi:hypothetical protein